MKVCILGAGLSGLTIAQLFRRKGHHVEVREKQSKIGGLCNDYYDREAKCYVNFYGPHIWHFSEKTREAYKFLRKYTKFIDYRHRVFCCGDCSFSFWPINKTYQDLFKILNPKKDIFKEFVESYSKKSWGKDFKKVSKRIRSRFKFKEDNNTDFFQNELVLMPKKGYGGLFKNLAKGIKVVFDTEETIDSMKEEMESFDKIIVTSPIDEFFNYKFGKLVYNGINFNFFELVSENEDILPTAVVNLNTHSKYTRMTEYNQFYKSKSKKRILCSEEQTLGKADIKIYPVLTEENLTLLKKYQDYSENFKKIYFLGRLGRYRYINMDQTVMEAIELFNQITR